MPGEDAQPPGHEPKRPKVLFGQTAAEQPAVGPPRTQPRILFGAYENGPPDEASGSEAEPKRQPTVLFGTPLDQLPKATEPKLLSGGTVRRRIPCTTADLQGLDVSATERVVAQALRLVQAVNLDDQHLEDIVRFGAQLQAEHAAITEAGLLIANDPSLQHEQLLVRMLGLLGDLHPEKVFASKGLSLAQALRNLAGPLRPPHEVFEAIFPQIVDLSQRVQANESALMAIAEKLTGLQERSAVLEERLAAAILAATFIVAYVRGQQFCAKTGAHYTAQADALESRLVSLLTTQTHLEVGRMTTGSLSTHVNGLIGASGEMLREDLPALYTAYTAALTTAVQSPTDLGMLSAVYRRARQTIEGGIRS